MRLHYIPFTCLTNVHTISDNTAIHNMYRQDVIISLIFLEDFPLKDMSRHR